MHDILLLTPFNKLPSLNNAPSKIKIKVEEFSMIGSKRGRVTEKARQ